VAVDPVYVLHAFLRNIGEFLSKMSPEKEKKKEKKKALSQL